MTKKQKKGEDFSFLKQSHDSKDFEVFCEIVIPKVPQAYTYGLKDSKNVKEGSVVWVQFGQRKPELGVVLRIIKERPSFKVKLAVPDSSAYSFSPRFMALLLWISHYYLCPIGASLAAFIPAAFTNYLDLLSKEKDKLKENSHGKIEEEVLLEIHKKLPPPLTLAQKKVCHQLKESLNKQGFRGVLLHGITGSGKTRVYQELVKESIKVDKRVLILVPEIALTPQTVDRFSAFLEEPIYVYHSALSVKQKRETWLQLLQKKARVLIGTRSAILAPFDFDVVILDEEHDASYKQHDPAPRYHCKEVAFHLAYKHGAMVVLGSATPSLESYYYAMQNKLLYLSLSERATEVSLPEVQLIDMQKEGVLQQKGVLLSSKLREAITDCLAAGNQAIILMNRRGYAKTRLCSSCGATLFCKNCNIPLVYHKQFQSLLCHYCASLYPVHSPCFTCGSETYEFQGGAIEKLEEEIINWIPSAKLIRMDRDTTQNVGSIEKILKAFRSEEYNVLLGTQMVTKGHDFPGVQLVGIVGADTGAGIPDFRMSERLFQLLSQTAGRAGRSREGALVLVQTMNPSDPIMRFALQHDYIGFANLELKMREMAHYPPFVKLLTVELGAKSFEVLMDAVHKLEALLKKHTQIEVLGPVEAFVPRVNKIYWQRFILKAASVSLFRKALKIAIENPKSLKIASSVIIKLEIN